MNVILLIRNLLFLSLGFIVLIAFSNFLEVTFFELFVNEKLEYANSSFLLDFVVIAALILYISLTVNKCLFTIPKKTITFFLLIVISFYIYERSFNDFFEFTRFRISDSFAYFDVAFVVVLMHFGHYLKFFVSTDTTDAQKNSIIDDSPISKDKDDQLEGLLKISADKIKKVILENKFAASFTIGLNGEWGDGGEPQYQINTTIQPKKTISTTRTLAKAIRDYEPIRERVQHTLLSVQRN
ncbi:hypothetical protein CGC54_01200 [Capnocytophaga canimorsus]|uniref:Uncharacterized protein n=1 Tax=Capnocytophaga canimorsus TaxID=28188 RepID=A0AAC9Z1A1_9FLAO|nr:hypothetical protein [Capnocytophaga canimorsus]ATA93059.1 hypothetical protein CGC54_01200 [Capnocytophaga canimorsus]